MTDITKVGRSFDAELSDGEWELKQTYADFGATMLAASNLEGQLLLALLYADFLVKIKAKAERRGGITMEQYKSALHRYTREQTTRTLGQVLRHVERLPVLDSDLRRRMGEARRLRNFLVHHFWRERTPTMKTIDDLRKVQNELHEIGEVFAKLAHDLEDAVKPIAESFGFNIEESNSSAEEFVAQLLYQDITGSTKTDVAWPDKDGSGIRR